MAKCRRQAHALRTITSRVSNTSDGRSVRASMAGVFGRARRPAPACSARPLRGTGHRDDVPEPRRRPGKKEDTHELVMSSLPYIVVYTVRGEAVDVVRILHGAQQWP